MTTTHGTLSRSFSDDRCGRQRGMVAGCTGRVEQIGRNPHNRRHAIYSPEFLQAQEEDLIAREVERGGALPGGSQASLAASTLRKFELWDVPPDQIQELENTGKPKKGLTLRSPMTGTVLEKNVLEWEYVTPQRELYVISDLSTVWVQAYIPNACPAIGSCPCDADRCFSPLPYYCGGKTYRQAWFRKWIEAHFGCGSMLEGFRCECIDPTEGKPRITSLDSAAVPAEAISPILTPK